MRERFDDVVFHAKREVVRGTLASELERRWPTRCCASRRADRRTRDHTLNTLREALAEVAACFPVYRTYIAERSQRRRTGATSIRPSTRARERLQCADAVGLRLRARMRCSDWPPDGATRRRATAAMRFARRFQQFSAPVAAKGVEDTAFYRYFRSRR